MFDTCKDYAFTVLEYTELLTVGASLAIMPRPGLIRETYLTVNQQMDVAKRQITQILMVKWLLVGKKLSCFFNVLKFEDILFFFVLNLTHGS